jgi:hypothetical protein
MIQDGRPGEQAASGNSDWQHEAPPTGDCWGLQQQGTWGNSGIGTSPYRGIPFCPK